MSIYEILSLVFSLSTTVAIIIAVVQIKINRKQLYISTITKCIADYRSFGFLRQSEEDHDTVRRYVDLVNEELFYIQFGYVPKEVAKEWIDGMVDYMAIIDSKNELLNHKYCLKYLKDTHKDIYTMFPRIVNAFTVNGNHDMDKIARVHDNKREIRLLNRQALINEIYANVIKYKG